MDMVDDVVGGVVKWYLDDPETSRDSSVSTIAFTCDWSKVPLGELWTGPIGS